MTAIPSHTGLYKTIDI